MFLAAMSIVGGLLLLVLGGEVLVRGASRLARVMGISPLIVGLTVVAFGTSSPELAVSVQAARNGTAEIALGNVVGSNTFNVLFILGISAIITPLVVSRTIIRREVPVMIGTSVVLMLMSLDGVVSRLDGFLLIIGLAAYLFWALRHTRCEKEPPAAHASNGQELTFQIALIVGGLVALGFGSHILVSGATLVATEIGMSQLIIGLTIVAVGTSLPEVVTSLTAAWRGERDIAVGNVVGSNIFNVLAVLGTASLVSPNGITVSSTALSLDIPVMLAASVACLPIFFSGSQIIRWEGTMLLGYYVVYTSYLVLAASESHFASVAGKLVALVVVPLTILTLSVNVANGIRTKAKARAAASLHG